MLTKVVSNVIFGRRFCRLCFGDVSDGDLRFHDEMLLNLQREKISAMLTYMLGGKYTSNMDVSDSFCSNCIQSMRNCYKFMKMCRTNSDHFDKVITKLNEALKNTECSKTSKSVLIQIDTTDYSYMQFYQYRKSVRDLPASLFKGRSKYLIANSKTTQTLSKNSVQKPSSLESFDMPLTETYSNKFEKPTEITKNLTTLESQHSKLKVLIQKNVADESLRHLTKLQRNKIKMKAIKQGLTEKQKLEIKQKIKRSDSPTDVKPNILRRSEKKFECDYCAKVYYCRDSLIYHVRKHSRKSPYVCTYCEMAFKVPNQLRDHVTKQHLEPCAQCDLCGIQFKQISAVYTHRKRHFNPKSSLYINLD